MNSTSILLAETFFGNSPSPKTKNFLSSFQEAMAIEFTNGLDCRVEIATNNEPTPQVTVYVRQDMKTFLGPYYDEAKTNLAFQKASDDKVRDELLMRLVQTKLAQDDWMFYLPTNLFCGPISLTSKNGVIISSTQPETLSSSYPSYFSLTEVKNHFSRSHVYYSGPPFPRPLTFPVERVAQFRIGRYFKINTNEVYQLIVSPKIYRRSATNNDLYERLDLSPVTILIK
jgi:hypothetical protein